MSFTQQGIVTQYELAKILIITSDGVRRGASPLPAELAGLDGIILVGH